MYPQVDSISSLKLLWNSYATFVLGFHSWWEGLGAETMFALS